MNSREAVLIPVIRYHAPGGASRRVLATWNPMLPAARGGVGVEKTSDRGTHDRCNDHAVNAVARTARR